MPLPLPQNCQFDDEHNGVAFELAVNNKSTKCFVSSEALEDHFGLCESKQAKVHGVKTTSAIGQKARQRMEAGDVEPIFLVTAMF